MFHLLCSEHVSLLNQRKTINVIPKRKKTSTEGEQSLPKLQRISERWGRQVSIYTLTHTLTYSTPTHKLTCQHAYTHHTESDKTPEKKREEGSKAGDRKTDKPPRPRHSEHSDLATKIHGVSQVGTPNALEGRNTWV